MQSLTLALFNQMRSYLTFKEMHATRAVAKDWNDIAPVSKCVYLDATVTNIPPIACFSNVTELFVFDDSERAKLYCERILHGCKSTLRLIDFDSNSQIQYIPKLLKVKELILTDANRTSVNNDFLYKCPNLKKIFFWESDEDVDELSNIDIRMLLQIEVISMNNWRVGDILNHVTHIGAIDHKFLISVHRAGAVENMAQLLVMNRNLVLELCDGDDVYFKVELDKMVLHHWEIDIDELKGWIRETKKARDVPLAIGDDMTVEETYQASLCLARTTLFTREEIKQMI